MQTESPFSDFVLPGVLVIIMFGMGTSLQFKDFKRISTHPKPVATGLTCQMILLPLVAFTIAWLSGLPPILKAGLILVAACPGGTSSNLLTYLLKGKVALSISLTAINSLLILFSVPFLIRLGLQVFVDKETKISLPFGETVLDIFLTILLPVLIGLLFQRKFRRLADKLQKVFKWLLPTILGAAFAGVLIFDESQEGQTLSFEDFIQIFPFALLLNISTLFLAYLFSRLLLSDKKSWYTIAIETGLQNSGLALFVAGTLLKNHQLSLVAVVYGSFSFFTTFLIAWWLKKIRH